MTLPDIITLLFSMSLSGFAAWRLFGLRALFRDFGRALLPRRRKKPKVDAIADMVSWKRARRLEDQQLWLADFDRLAPPTIDLTAKTFARAVGWTVLQQPGQVTTATSAHGNTVLAWTSAGWQVVQHDRRVSADAIRLKWINEQETGHGRPLKMQVKK